MSENTWKCCCGWLNLHNMPVCKRCNTERLKSVHQTQTKYHPINCKYNKTHHNQYQCHPKSHNYHKSSINENQKNAGSWSWGNTGNWKDFERATSKQIDYEIRKQWNNTNDHILKFALTKGTYFSKAPNRYICTVELNETRTEIRNIYQVNVETNKIRSIKRTPSFTLNPYRNSNNKVGLMTNNNMINDKIINMVKNQIPDGALSLFQASNSNNIIHNAATPTIRCNLKVVECASLHRLIGILSKYREYIKNGCRNINKMNAKLNIKEDVFSYGYDIVNILNDYHHLLFHHKIEYENIYDKINMVIYDNKTCNVLKCVSIIRNRRNRSDIKQNENLLNKLYFSNDMVEQQVLDMIHCYFMHSFDTAHRVRTDDIKTNDDICSNMSDETLSNINQKLIETKKSTLHIIDDTNKSTKFVTNTCQYSIGHRFFYWDYYKNNKNEFDDAAAIAINSIKDRDWRSPKYSQQILSGSYIEKKHNNFKQEMTENKICVLSRKQWDNTVEKAATFLKTNIGKKMKCERKESAQCYEMKHEEPVKCHHLIAVIMYTDYDELSNKFSQTYRKLHGTMQIFELKERHSNYYHFGRYLRECVECFGMKSPSTDFVVYHGIDKHVTFASVHPHFKGPFSTTRDYAVAVNFCNNTGMILEDKIIINEWRMKINSDTLNCFDCQWISCHGNEQEILFLGGIARHTLITIIDVAESTNYTEYIKGLSYMAYCASNTEFPLGLLTDNRPKTKNEKQMVFRLMSHELYRYNQFHKIPIKNQPKSKLANKFKSCPKYIENMLHKICMTVKRVFFYDKMYFKDNKENFIFETFFKCNNGWIELQRFMTVFPNIDFIAFQVDNGDTINNSLMISLLSFIKNSSLRGISVILERKYKDKIQAVVHKNEKAFAIFGWKFTVDYVDIDKLEGIGVNSKTIKEELIKNRIETDIINRMDNSLHLSISSVT